MIQPIEIPQESRSYQSVSNEQQSQSNPKFIQSRQSVQIINSMKKYEIVYITIFLLNILIYFNMDQNNKFIAYVQLLFAMLCGILIFTLQFKKNSIPYIIIIPLTLLITIVSIFTKANRLYMLVPLIFLAGVEGIRKKISLIREVFLESIWMLICLTIFYYIFGTIGYMIFDQNIDYFDTQLEGSLSILQISTLDQVGQITRLNYKEEGFMISFCLVLAALLLIHTMLNLNMAFILQYISDKKNNKQILSSKSELLGPHLPLQQSILKNLNILVSIYILIYPFQYQIFGIYYVTTFVSFCFVTFMQVKKDSVNGILFSMNIALQLLVTITYVIDQRQLFFIFCLLRIFLIQQVINLIKKVVKSIFSVTALISISIISFLIFSLIILILERERDEELKNIALSLIEALQILTLDDWTKILRNHSWYTGLVVIVYILLVNHLFINAIIAQVFSLNQREQKGVVVNKQKQDYSQIQNGVEEINEEKQIRKYLEIITLLGCKLQKSNQQQQINNS